MVNFQQHALILFNILILFIVLLLTLSDSSYTCSVTVNGVRGTCAEHPEYGILDNQTTICQDTVFIISAEHSTKTAEGTITKSVLILCPWSDKAISFTTLGFIAAVIFTVITVIQGIYKRLPKKMVMLIGLFTLPILLFSTIFMLTGISDGGEKCTEFEQHLGSHHSEAHCTNGLFGVTFILSLIAMLIFGYEALQGYQSYKYYMNDFENYFKKNSDAYTEITVDKGQDLRTFYVNEDD